MSRQEQAVPDITGSRKPNDDIFADFTHDSSDRGEHSPVSLADLFLVLYRSWYWIALSTILFLSLGILYLGVTPPRYTATAQLLIETRQSNIISSFSVLPGLNPDAPLIESQVEIIKSKEVIERAIRLLRKNKVQQGKSKKSTTSDSSVTDTKRDNTIAQIGDKDVSEFLKRLKVQRKGLTYLIIVHYTDTDRSYAADAANAVIRSYIDFQRETRRASTLNANKWLLVRKGALREELRRADDAMQAFKSIHRLTTIGGQTIVELETVAIVNQLASMRAAAARLDAQVRQVSRFRDDPEKLMGMAEALQSALIRDYRTQYTTVQRKLTRVRNLYGEEASDAVTARAELDGIRNQISAEIGRIVQRLRNDHELTSTQVTLLEQQLTKIVKRVAAQNKNAVRLTQMERESAATTKLYLSFLTRSKETKSQEDLQTTDAIILAKAAPPRLVSYPRKGLSLGLALLGGLGSGIILALGLNLLHPKLFNPAEVDRKFDIEKTGHLPRLKGRNSPNNVRRPVHTRKDDAFTNAMYTFVSGLEQREAGARGQVIMVTSALGKEGKSMVAVNLADYYTITGQKTLLIDACPRSSFLSRVFGGSEQGTLDDIIDGEKIPGDVLAKVEDGDFDFCPAPLPDDQLAFMKTIASDGMTRFMQTARNNYDVIIFDTPSLIGFSSAQAIATVCDSIIMVIKRGSTPVNEIRRAMGKLPGSRRKQIMAILNDI